jgi:hypothetical protein
MEATAAAPRPDPCGPRALWAHATAAERATVLAVAVVLVVITVLASLDHAVLPVVLVGDAVVLARLRAVLRRRRREDDRIRDEAAHGQREIERWLASGEVA